MLEGWHHKDICQALIQRNWSGPTTLDLDLPGIGKVLGFQRGNDTLQIRFVIDDIQFKCQER
jgi:hypothetical protein